MTRVLIADNTHPILEQSLREAGCDVCVQPDHNYESLLQAAQQYDVLVVRSKVDIDRRFIDAVPRLRIIGRVGAGMETIDTAYATSRGIRCLNSPEGNRDAVGEHAVGMLLCLLNNISRADAEVRQGLWRREANRGHELGDMTVGIIGLSNMGLAFARRLSGFGCRLVAYDKYKPAGHAPCGIEEVSLQQLLQEADVISMHVPLTDETRHYVDAHFIASVAKPFYLVNTSRGAVVDTEAVAQALDEGKILGAALDVLEYENMQSDSLGELPDAVRRLLHSPHTVLTPHVAGWTVESKYKLASVLAKKIIDALQ